MEAKEVDDTGNCVKDQPLLTAYTHTHCLDVDRTLCYLRHADSGTCAKQT